MSKKTFSFDANNIKINPRTNSDVDLEFVAYVSEVLDCLEPDEIGQQYSKIDKVLDYFDATTIADKFHDPEALYNELKKQFTDEDIND